MEKVEQLEMPPWEQHASVINMPRFLYTASSSLHQTSHAGFLITCPFRREKSATREAMEFLQKYVQLCHEMTSSFCKSENCNVQAVGEEQSPGSATRKVANHANVLLRTDRSKIAPSDGSLMLQELAPLPKRLKCTVTKTAECDVCVSNSCTDTATEVGKGSTDPPDKDVRNLEKALGVEEMPHGHMAPVNVLSVPPFSAIHLVPVKLAKMGVIFITAPTLLSSSVLFVVSRILDDIQGGVMAPPQWCHRILPVQATCSLKQSALQAAVGELFRQHLREVAKKRGEHLKFAVAFNRRGAEEQATCVGEETPLDRHQCISAVTEAVVKAFPNISVDLSTPQVVIVVEVLPLSGSKAFAVCAVSVLPGRLVDAKPRLCIRPLIQSKKKRPQ